MWGHATKQHPIFYFCYNAKFKATCWPFFLNETYYVRQHSIKKTYLRAICLAQLLFELLLQMKGIFYTSVIWAWLCGALGRGTGEIRDPNVSHRCVIISSPDAWHSDEQSVFYGFWDQVQEDGNPTLRNTGVLSLIRSPLSSPRDDDPTRGLRRLPAPDGCWSPSLTCLNKQHGWAMRFLICVRAMKKCSREGVQ